MPSSVKVFISYSHDDDGHKSWVYSLACKLLENGVDTILAQWDLQFGSNLLGFMERGLANSDRVIVVCTDNYNKKANAGIGGVGYEKNILTAELYVNQDTAKFIPCIRGASGAMKTPICLASRAYIDFSDNALFDVSLKHLLHELYGFPLRPKPGLGMSPFATKKEEIPPSTARQSSTAFFSYRFGKAFPGVRHFQWFRNPIEAVQRLKIFFTEPFVFRNSYPIWWWRSGDMHIDSFKVISPNTVLIDHHEYEVEEMAAVNAGSYFQTFIYIKTRASEPSGLNDHSPIQDQIDSFGYAREEFALYKGHAIKRAEYDDGAAVIDGKVVDVGEDAELRVRYLSSYNLILAPHGSPINNKNVDQTRVQLLNGMLKNETSLEHLTAAILKLPKRELDAT